MRTRLAITFLLIVSMTTLGASRPFIRDCSPAAQQDTELTPEEEREARELAVRLLKRLRETDDFGPLVSELFVADMVERLQGLVRRANPLDELFALCARETILQADASDLRRAYIALLNFWNQQDQLGTAAWNYVKVKDRGEGKDALKDQEAWGLHLRLKEEAVPEEAFRIAQSDPLLDAAFNLVRQDKGVDDEASSEANEGNIEAATIKDIARLRAFMEKLEQCTSLLRKGVEKLRYETKAVAVAYGLSEKSLADELKPEDKFKVYHFDSERLETETFGLPVGTTLIRVRIYPYEMAMARVDGQLKILAVYPDFDGD